MPTETQINEMANRFLSWSLPEDFLPDAGIRFDPMYNVGTAYPALHKPTGTNLFTHTQAVAMIRHMLPELEQANAGLIEQLKRILPGLENSSSAAEDAMIRALPKVIAALESANNERAAGIEAAANLIDKKVADYIKDFGSDDPATGQTEFSAAGEEYISTLEELADEIRALALKPEAI